MHTPGPWKQLRDEVWVGKRRICSHVSAGESLPLGEDYKRGMENARLIAAAPDLLEALLDMTQHYCTLVNSGDAGNWDPEKEPVVKAAISAIAKASGGK